MIKKLKEPIYCSNCYIVWENTLNKCLIIDPGDPDISLLIKFLNKNQLIPDFVIFTHEHFDHIAGAEELSKYYSIRTIASKECAIRIADPKLNLSLYAYMDGIGAKCSVVDIVVEDKEWQIEWAGRQLRTFLTPGHSPGGMCVSIESMLFTGDTILPGKKIITRLPGSDRIAAKNSLDFIFSRFYPKSFIFPGHGEPFPISEIDFSNLI